MNNEDKGFTDYECVICGKESIWHNSAVQILY